MPKNERRYITMYRRKSLLKVELLVHFLACFSANKNNGELGVILPQLRVIL